MSTIVANLAKIVNGIMKRGQSSKNGVFPILYNNPNRITYIKKPNSSLLLTNAPSTITTLKGINQLNSC